MRNLFLLFSFILLVGCKSQTELQQETKASFDNPEFIGKVSGKDLYRVTVVRYHHDHYVYFFKDSPEVSINYQVSAGKTTRTEVIVLVNGKPVSTNLLEKP